MNFILKSNGSVVVFAKGKPHTFAPDAVNYDAIVDALKAEDWATVESLVDVRTYVAEYTNGDVEIAGNTIYFKKQEMKGELGSRMIHMFRNGFNIDPMVRFLENLDKNPSESSKQELWGFLEVNDLPLTNDGHFLAYKRVRDDYLDCYSGTIRNKIGDKPKMTREDVNDNRHETCSRGLHFCSYSYLKSFGGGRLMVLKIHPKDVVSIPVDYNNAKGRCCEYIVVDEIHDNTSEMKDKYHTDSYAEYAEYNEYDEDDDDLDDIDMTEDDEDFVHPKTLAAQNNGSNLNEDDIKVIRKLCADGNMYLRQIGEKFRISERQVRRIRDREAWDWVD